MNSQSIILQSDDRLLSYFLSETVKNMFNIGDRSEKEKRTSMIGFIFLGLIVIVATEPLKVLLRKNIGKLSFSMPRLVTASVLYLIWATVLFFLPEQSNLKMYRTFLYAGGIFYVLFALFVLISGIIEYRKARVKYNQNPNQTLAHLYRGDSILFRRFLHKGKNQNKIWMKTEPLFCFLIGLGLTIFPAFVHPVLSLIGAPILLTSLSFWFNEWYQINNVWNVQVKKILKEKQKKARRQCFQGEEEYFTVRSSP